MPADASRVVQVVYDNWSQGSAFSQLDSGKQEQALQYHAVNMQLYDTGELGPRPWTRVWASTGAVGADTLDSNAACQYRPNEVYLGQLWVNSLSGDIWYYDFSTSTWSAHTGIDTYVAARQDGASVFYTERGHADPTALSGSAVYKTLPHDNWIFQGEGGIDSTDTAFDVVTGGSNSHLSFTLYRDRIWSWTFAGPVTDPGNRLYYSDAGSYVAWTAGNFIDIGADSDNYYIIGAWPVRDSLLIAMSNGTWWTFTGTPETGTLRFVGEYVVPAHGGAVAQLDNALYFLNPTDSHICVATPQGVETRSFLHMRPRNAAPVLQDPPDDYYVHHRALGSEGAQAIILNFANSLTYPGQSKDWHAIEMVNNAWQEVEYFNETGSSAVLRDAAIVGDGRAIAFVVEDSSQTPETQIITRDIRLNRPSSGDDTWSAKEEVGPATTSDANGKVTLAKFVPAANEEVRMLNVIVEGRSWVNGLGYPTPHMKAQINVGASGAEINNFDDTLLSNGEGKPYRWVFPRPEVHGFETYAQVTLLDIKALTITRVIVEYEIRPVNHWQGRMGGT